MKKFLKYLLYILVGIFALIGIFAIGGLWYLYSHGYDIQIVVIMYPVGAVFCTIDPEDVLIPGSTELVRHAYHIMLRDICFHFRDPFGIRTVDLFDQLI